MKRIMLMLLPVSLIAFLSGCSLFVKEVDYQTIANDLNEKNMDKILNAVDGYAILNHDGYLITSIPEDSSKISKETDELNLKIVYNTVDNRAMGAGIKKNASSIEVDEKEEQKSEEKSPGFSVVYEDNKYVNREKHEELDLLFLIDKLQGIEKVVPKSYEYGIDRPPRISYDLNEQEFNEIINDDLKIDYDNFQKATIYIELDERNNEFTITEIDIGVIWGEYDSNKKMVDYHLNNRVFYNGDNLDARNDYKHMEMEGS